MKEKIIQVKNLTKKYNLYEKPIDRLKESLNPFKKSYHKEFYALKDITFEILKGETIGLVGKNGAGKSTLLKIITGVLTQTSGEISANGKIAALLELGAGFNQEYTGIENIYFNGALMGCSKMDMDSKLKSIIDFADIGDFIYQPVKTYSSGMFARLAFSVAIHVDPEILIVDEALAVGDAAFALKCMNHMRKIVDKGKTIIFVTHDIQTIRSFCTKVIWLDKGEVRKIGDSYEVTSEYTRYLFEGEKNSELDNEILKDGIYDVSQEVSIDFEEEKLNEHKFKNSIRWGTGEVEIYDVSLLNSKNEDTDVIEWGEKITIIIKARAVEDIDNSNIGLGFSLRNKKALDILTSTTIDEIKPISKVKKGQRIIAKFELENILSPGEYFLVAAAEERADKVPNYYDYIEDAVCLKVLGEGNFFSLVKQQVKQEIRCI